jgi:dethiobiotin synthetase
MAGPFPRMGSKIIFITGTDTGVGKTLLTALLLCHLRQSGRRALAMKPFCSGGRADAELLHALQDDELSLDEINPFYFPEPLAPLAATRKGRRSISLREVESRIRHVRTKLVAPESALLIEGSGGLLVPLGENYTCLDLIKKLRCEVIVVSRNRLGTLNHTLLTVQALRHAGIAPSALKVVLMDRLARDPSCASNPALLEKLLAPVAFFSVPFLGPRSQVVARIKSNAARIRQILAGLAED